MSDDTAIQGWKPPTIYDNSIDQHRIATQADIDKLVLVQQAYSRLLGHVRDMIAEKEALQAAVRAALGEAHSG